MQAPLFKIVPVIDLYSNPICWLPQIAVKLDVLECPIYPAMNATKRLLLPRNMTVTEVNSFFHVWRSNCNKSVNFQQGAEAMIDR